MILVTGANGNVGGEVCRLLRAQGVPLRAAVRDPAQVAGDGVHFDFEQPATFAPALAGVERLFLMRPPSISDVKRYLFPVVDAARAAGVRQVVFLSLLGAERNPWVPHRHVELYLEASGLPYTFLRPSFFMQNLSTVHVADIRDRDEISVPAGHGKTSFIDARDIAAVAALTLVEDGHERRAYPLTGDAALSYTEVAAILSDVLGRPIRYTDPWIPEFVLRLVNQGQPLAFVLVMVGIYTTAKLGLAGGLTGDTRRLLGRAPIGFRQFALDHQNLWRGPEANGRQPL